MVKLLKKHPFVKAALELERKEVREGVSDEVVAKRKRLKEEFPELFENYMSAKRKKQEERKEADKKERQRQLRKWGSETVSFSKEKMQEEKRKRRKK